MSPPAARILQLAYVVRDLEASAMRWVRLAGAGPFFIAGFRLSGQHYRGRAAEINVKVAFGYLGSMMLELVQSNDGAPSIFNEVLNARGEGLHHYLMDCADFDAEIARYAELGCAVGAGGPLPGMGRTAMIDTNDLGAFTELVELAPAALRMWETMRQAHLGWDGSEPLRAFPALA